jgi:hypothetical protein
MEEILAGLLEKKNRYGQYQPKFYRFEQGFLSSWASSAECKQGKDATLTIDLALDVTAIDHKGGKVFSVLLKEEKPLVLRCPTDSDCLRWCHVLKSALNDALSQLQATGAVYCRRGTGQGFAEEAQDDWSTALTTERFLTAANLSDAERYDAHHFSIVQILPANHTLYIVLCSSEMPLNAHVGRALTAICTCNNARTV